MKLYLASKRIIDIIVSSIVVGVSPPLLLILWALVKLDDGGPLFYSQIRVGKNGKLFKFWKFRTMRIDADLIKHQIKSDDQSIRFKAKNDPRITKVGKFLRKLSLDELPQFWNILIGDMSIVGPRPALIEEVNQYNNYQKQRLDVEQGLTCIWQVSGRSLIPFEQQVEMDISYIKTRSLLTDFKLIIKTIPAMLFGKGAY